MTLNIEGGVESFQNGLFMLCSKRYHVFDTFNINVQCWILSKFSTIIHLFVIKHNWAKFKAFKVTWFYGIFLLLNEFIRKSHTCVFMISIKLTSIYTVENLSNTRFNTLFHNTSIFQLLWVFFKYVFSISNCFWLQQLAADSPHVMIFHFYKKSLDIAIYLISKIIKTTSLFKISKSFFSVWPASVLYIYKMNFVQNECIYHIP